MNQFTQQYITLIENPPVKSLTAFEAGLIVFQQTVPQYAAELSLETSPLQQAVNAETDPAYTLPLANAYQRTAFLTNRLDRLNALLQEIRTGLKDLATDQQAVINGGYPPVVGDSLT